MILKISLKLLNGIIVVLMMYCQALVAEEALHTQHYWADLSLDSEGRVVAVDLPELDDESRLSQVLSEEIRQWGFPEAEQNGLKVASTTSVYFDVDYQVLSDGRYQPIMKIVSTGPRPIKYLRPEYPSAAIENRVDGFVEMTYDINRNGRVKNVQVVESYPEKLFDQSAIAALEAWRFKMPTVNGEPIVVTNQMQYLNFKLESD